MTEDNSVVALMMVVTWSFIASFASLLSLGVNMNRMSIVESNVRHRQISSYACLFVVSCKCVVNFQLLIITFWFLLKMMDSSCFIIRLVSLM